MSDLWQPLGLSVLIALSATFLAALIALPTAFWLSRKRFWGKSLLEALLMLPLVLPPTVVGFVLILLLGSRGWVGQVLKHWFDYTLTFRFEAAVLAALIVSFPMLFLPAQAGFAGIAREHLDIARSLGANRWTLFWNVALPLAYRPIVSGLLLAFARSLGEFGATIIVFGWQQNRLTLPISIYSDYEQGNFAHAWPAIIALLVISMSITLTLNVSRLQGSKP